MSSKYPSYGDESYVDPLGPYYSSEDVVEYEEGYGSFQSPGTSTGYGSTYGTGTAEGGHRNNWPSY